jgi:hypothetical protein
MRQAYKDPMNKEDGTWRMIYVGPAGQLIGSLKPPQTLQLPGQPGAPAAANPQQNTAFGSSAFGSAFGQSQPTQAGSQQGTTPQTGTNSAQPAAGTPGSAAADDAAASATPSGLISDSSSVVGGNIIGVGSKINKRSVIIYDKAKNYRLFEFIWNPSKELANALNQQIGAPNQPGAAPAQGGFGQTGFGQPNNQQYNPPANAPGQPTPAPAPTQNPPQQ